VQSTISPPDGPGRSSRSTAPADLPRELLESEAVRNERGARHRRHKLKIGKFEAAHINGPSSSDEIGDSHPRSWPKAALLQDGEFSRIVGNRR